MKLYKKISISILIILVIILALPTIVLGSTFISSLIQGKSVPEAIQILAERIQSLAGRVEKVENRQTEQDKEIAIQKAYNEFRQAYDKVWLRGKTEESTVKDTREYCQGAIKEGNVAKANNFCPLADELEKTWNNYQNLLK